MGGVRAKLSADSNDMKKSSYHRLDIDGLRALAIIPVILFHAGIAGFGGGFIGVDIFFVISGFLIASIIIRELKAGTFSLVHFWERRVRRIIPVLFFIMLVVTGAAHFIVLFPVDYIVYGQSLVAQSAFLANIYFMRKDSYFAGPSESMPLLHTWTLSLEEQFYIFLPLFLLGIFVLAKRSLKALTVAVVAVLVLSFAYNYYLSVTFPGGAFTLPFISHIWGSATNARAAFFFLLPRAWEFLIGVLLATGAIALRSRWQAELASLIGLGLICYAIVQFSASMVFPGVAALVPTIGAALIILAGSFGSTLVGSLLSFRAFVFTGLISYSLYLWHWPLIVFSKILWPENASSLMGLVLVFTFVLSWVSYQYVETPFRTKQFCASRSQMFLFGSAAIAILFSLGLLIHRGDGFPNRAPAAANAIAAAAVDSNPREYECFRKNYRDVFGAAKPCVLGDQSGSEYDFVLWGDSNADAAMPIIDEMAREYGQTGVFFGAGGCRPIIWGDETVKDQKCEVIKQQAVDFINEHNVPKVLLISAWGAIGKNASPVGTPTEQIDEDADAFYRALSGTLALIETDNNTIYIMKKVPNYNYDVRVEFMEAVQSNVPMSDITKPYADYQAVNASQNLAIDRLQAEGRIVSVDPSPAFCSDEVCAAVIDGAILYRNGSHINTTGALRLRPIFTDFFTQ